MLLALVFNFTTNASNINENKIENAREYLKSLLDTSTAKHNIESQEIIPLSELSESELEYLKTTDEYKDVVNKVNERMTDDYMNPDRELIKLVKKK